MLRITKKRMSKIIALLVKYSELLRRYNFPFYSTDVFTIKQFGFITKHHNSMKTDYILILQLKQTHLRLQITRHYLNPKQRTVM